MIDMQLSRACLANCFVCGTPVVRLASELSLLLNLYKAFEGIGISQLHSIGIRDELPSESWKPAMQGLSAFHWIAACSQPY